MNLFATRCLLLALQAGTLLVALITLARLAITCLPQLQPVFDTAGRSFVDGVIIIGIGVALLATIETEKKIRLLPHHLDAA